MQYGQNEEFSMEFWIFLLIYPLHDFRYNKDSNSVVTLLFKNNNGESTLHYIPMILIKHCLLYY